MSWLFGFILFCVAIASAVSALMIRDLLVAALMLMAYSFAVALLFAEMGAVDVAFTEAAIGAGISGVFLIAALFHLSRRSKD